MTEGAEIRKVYAGLTNSQRRTLAVFEQERALRNHQIIDSAYLSITSLDGFHWSSLALLVRKGLIHEGWFAGSHFYELTELGELVGPMALMEQRGGLL